MKKRFQFEAYKKKCKNCGNEMLVTNSKEEICWRCKEEIRKQLRKSR